MLTDAKRLHGRARKDDALRDLLVDALYEAAGEVFATAEGGIVEAPDRSAIRVRFAKADREFEIRVREKFA